MTDNEIIKALECCNSNERGNCLNKCPYYNHSATCTQSMIADTLDLINRQKAELERLLEDVSSINDEIYEIGTRKAEELAEELTKAQVEAIKDFWRRVRDYATDFGYTHIVVFGNNLVKEMVGDAE